MIVTFPIPANLWLTSNRHTVNRGHRARIVANLHELASECALEQNLGTLTGRVYVDWEIRYPKGVRTDKGDASNAQPTTKALLDGIVHAGHLVDDGPKYVVSETFRRGPNLAHRGIHEVRLTFASQEVPW
jgi:hypothetical protein